MEIIEDNVNGKKLEKLVYIVNMSEDVWPFIQAISDEKARANEIEENANLSDRELYAIAEEREVIFVSPKPINPSFVSYFKALVGMKDLVILVPKKHTGKICEDMMKDSAIMESLETAANSVRKLTLMSYAASEQFSALVKELRSRGITVYTPEAPADESGWTVNFFGSKSGIRQLGQQSIAKEPDFMMPHGLIAVSTYDAAMIAANKYIKEGGVVIKTNKGHAGAGVLIFRPNDLPKEYEACKEKIVSILKKDKYWDEFPIVIEDLVNVNQSIAGGFPNVEFKIDKSGKINFLYYCGLRVTKDGVFKGIKIHDDALTDRVAARIMDTGFFIGEQYAANGYRGYFDVDYIAAKNGDIYVSESNTRRTGGTFVYKIALELFGKDFMVNTCIASNNMYQLPEHFHTSFDEVLVLLSDILWNKEKKEGIVIGSANILSQGYLTYIIFGATEKRVEEIETQMEHLLSSRQ